MVQGVAGPSGHDPKAKRACTRVFERCAARLISPRQSAMTVHHQTGAISKLREIYSLLSRSERRHLLALLCLMLLTTLIEVVGVGSIFPLLQILSTPDRFAQGAIAAYFKNFGLTSTNEITLFLIAVFAIFLVLSNLLSVFVLSESAKFAWTNWRNVSTRAFRHYLEQPYEFFLGRNSADLTKVITQDSMVLGNGVLLPMLQVTAKVLVIVALGLTLLAFEPVTTLLLLAFFTSAYGAFSLYSHRVVRKLASISHKGRAQSTRVASEALRGIKEVKTFGKEGYFVRQFAREQAPVPNAEKSITLLGGSPRYYLEAITIAIVLSGLGIAVYKQVSLAALIPSIGLFVIAGYRMLPLFSSGFSNLNTLTAYLVTVDDMLADLRAHRVAPAAVAAAPESVDGPYGFAEIVLTDITYSYPQAAAPALRKLSLTLEPGKKLGLLGTSGGGKSTLIDVLLTLLEPQSGHVRMGNVPIERSNAHRLRSRIGYVPQSIFLTDQSILRNIAFAVDEKEIDMEAVIRAAKQSNIHEFILSLEQGYQTMIGERGVRLSGGQGQRLGIARALYSDPPVIAFDEATSALDTETEAAVMDAIDHLDSKTVIIAAHRLSTLRRCDAVYEVKNGRLIYLGRGETLSQPHGIAVSAA
jgi:ATP-binding cassette, subfamily B, bacterial PglK